MKGDNDALAISTVDGPVPRFLVSVGIDLGILHKVRLRQNVYVLHVLSVLVLRPRDTEGHSREALATDDALVAVEDVQRAGRTIPLVAEVSCKNRPGIVFEILRFIEALGV